MENKQLVTFWLEPDINAAFTDACREEGKSKSSVLRKAVLLMLETRKAGKDTRNGR